MDNSNCLKYIYDHGASIFTHPMKYSFLYVVHIIFIYSKDGFS